MTMRLYDKDIKRYVVNNILYINESFVNDIFSIGGVVDSSDQSYTKNLEIHEIKTVSKIIIQNIHNKYLIVSLIKCEVKVVEVINIQIDLLEVSNHNPENSKKDDISHNFKKSQILEIHSSVFERFYIEKSSFKRIEVDNCEILSDAIIEKNNNLEECRFKNSEVHSLDIRGPAGIKHINLGGKKEIEHVHITNLNFDQESSNFYIYCPIKDLKISECKSNIELRIIGKELGEIDLINKSTFKSVIINNKNSNIKINNCKIDEKLTIDLEPTQTLESKDNKAISSKFEITNNTIGKGISIGKHHITEELKIEGNHLQNGNWKLNGLSLGGNCTSKITDLDIDKFIFTNCDFSNFDFQDTDIFSAEISDPNWNEVDDFTFVGKCSKKENLNIIQRINCWLLCPLLKLFNLANLDNQKRIKFKGDNVDLDKNELKKLKKQYSFFRKKFESENNYVDASKFKISEKLTQIKILNKDNYLRSFLLSFSKCLNLFGESIAKPFYYYCIVLLLFTLLYLFNGYTVTNIVEDKVDGKFVSKNQIVHINYDFQCCDFSRLYSTDFSDVKHFFNAMMLSFKNIIPIKLDSSYYLSIDAKFPVSQNLSMLQKLLNIIILGALITSMRNFYRK